MTSSERQPERPPKTLERVERQWTKLGERDPLWAILTEPEKRSGQWNEQEFFETVPSGCFRSRSRIGCGGYALGARRRSNRTSSAKHPFKLWSVSLEARS